MLLRVLDQVALWQTVTEILNRYDDEPLLSLSLSLHQSLGSIRTQSLLYEGWPCLTLPVRRTSGPNSCPFLLFGSEHLEVCSPVSDWVLLQRLESLGCLLVSLRRRCGTESCVQVLSVHLTFATLLDDARCRGVSSLRRSHTHTLFTGAAIPFLPLG